MKTVLTIEKAKKMVDRIRSGYNYCTEFQDAYLFSHKGSMNIGDEPIAVLKETGKILPMPVFCNGGHGRPIGEYDLE